MRISRQPPGLATSRLHRGEGRGFAEGRRLLAVLALAVAMCGSAVVLAGDTAVEMYLPELQQMRGQNLLEHQRFAANNNLIFIATVDELVRNNAYTVTVKEVLKTGPNSRKVDVEESLDVQCWMLPLEKGKTYLMPVYLWGQGNNPASAQTLPIELNKDFKNDPRYKLFKFMVADDADSAPAAWSQATWELYKALKPGDFQKDGRLALMGFMAEKHPDRIDGNHAEWMKEVDRLLHEELLSPEKLKAVEQSPAAGQLEFERALLVVVTLYAHKAGIQAADEAAKLLALTPLALRAIDPLVALIDDESRVGFEEKFLPILKKQLEGKRSDRQEIQALYLARVLKSNKAADAVKEALEADPKRPDSALLARLLVMMRGPDAWPVVQKVYEGWDGQEGYPGVWLKVDTIKQTIEHVGRPCYPTVVKALKRSQQMQQMVYQFFSGLPADAKEDFGCALLETGIHAVLPYLLQGQQGMPQARTIEYVVRYAVGEVGIAEGGDPNMMMNEQAQLSNSCQQARQWLKARLKVDVSSRADFNDWYLGRLEELKLEVPAELAGKVAEWKEGLSSPQGEVREKTEKELRELGEKGLPVLLDLEHAATDLATRQTSRALLLELPIAPQVFVFEK